MAAIGLIPAVATVALNSGLFVVTWMIILIHQLLYLSLGIQTFAAELVIWYQSQVAVVLDCAPGDIQKHRNLLVCQKTYAAEYRVMAVADNPDGFKRLPCLFSC